MSEYEIDLLLLRLENDYPTQYNVRILRQAAATIRELNDEIDMLRNRLYGENNAQ